MEGSLYVIWLFDCLLFFLFGSELRLGGVGSIDAFIEESEKSLATHVGLFSLKLGAKEWRQFFRKWPRDPTWGPVSWKLLFYLTPDAWQKNICDKW